MAKRNTLVDIGILGDKLEVTLLGRSQQKIGLSPLFTLSHGLSM